MSTAAWIVVAIVAVVVIAAVIAAVVLGRGRRTEARRREAEEIRERARSADVTVQRREAEAAEVQAKARAAQGEADARAAQAAQLQADAQQRAEHARSSRGELDQQLRHADEVDPDVSTDGEAVGRDANDAAEGTVDGPGAHRAHDPSAVRDDLRAPEQRRTEDEPRNVDLAGENTDAGARGDRPAGAPPA
jgi:predicted membrane-bound mannosyltransferase